MWSDPRWVNGTWDLEQFKTKDGETDWNAVIDAEVVHRKALEDCPAVYDEDGLFDTSIVPWWVWVKRFHLPEAEKINGRAAMVGYAFAYLIDAAGGAGLVDLHQSFLGKTAIFLTVAFCLTVRRLEDLDTLSARGRGHLLRQAVERDLVQLRPRLREGEVSLLFLLQKSATTASRAPRDRR